MMSVVGTAKIEYWPHNGRAPHVVLVKEGNGPAAIVHAYFSRADAEMRVDGIALMWGSIWQNTIQVLRP